MLRVYNDLGRELQDFEPLREGFIGVYVCGPTVYGHSHIGHAKSYVSFDAVVRYLRYRFPDHAVRYVQNITDVGHILEDVGEDRVLRKARELGVQPMEVAETFTRSYFEDMDALGVLRPDISPRASGHVPEQIEMVERLIEGGHAYEADGNVYFDVQSFPEYGKLSGRNLDEMIEAVRVEAREEKRHPADFAVWKRAEPEHVMRWRSPWGEGFPGWHLECSVMAQKYLGETIDIHGGGLDNLFPHHEDEVAQAEAASGQPFVRYWMHNNMVTVGGQKMSKSLGNFITLKDAFAGEEPLERPVRPLALRYFILTSHYRSPLDFTPDALAGAEKGLERIENAVGRLRRALAGAEEEGEPSEQVAALVERTREQFVEEMDNDFNTAGAIGALSTFTREVNALLDEGGLTGADLAALDGLYRELGGDVLGIVTEETGQQAGSGIGPDLIEAMLAAREELREAKQFELADRIRDRLEELGVEVQDSPEGPTWRLR
jgi:cysteinyl-tRNA synthetase